MKIPDEEFIYMFIIMHNIQCIKKKYFFKNVLENGPHCMCVCEKTSISSLYPEHEHTRRHTHSLSVFHHRISICTHSLSSLTCGLSIIALLKAVSVSMGVTLFRSKSASRLLALRLTTSSTHTRASFWTALPLIPALTQGLMGYIFKGVCLYHCAWDERRAIRASPGGGGVSEDGF